MERQYLEPQPIGRDDATSAFASGDIDRIAGALVSTALFDPDSRWIEHWCQHFLGSDEWQLRAIAATCVGHLARLHGTVAGATVTAVRSLQNDRRTAGQAQNALADIERFGANDPSK